MVLLKRRCDPADRKAVIAVNLTTEPSILSLSSASNDPPFRLCVHLRIESSIQPGRPITIVTNHTVFHHTVFDPSGGIDTLSLGAFGGGLVCTTKSDKRISLGFFRVHRARQDTDEEPDLRDRVGTEFVTIPGDGSEVVVTHDLPIGRMFRFEERWKPEDMEPGEKYMARISDGWLGTTWWCWGDMEGDLKKKKLSAWARGPVTFGMKPSEEEIAQGLWVLGEAIPQLVFEDRSGGTEFTIAE